MILKNMTLSNVSKGSFAISCKRITEEGRMLVTVHMRPMTSLSFTRQLSVALNRL